MTMLISGRNKNRPDLFGTVFISTNFSFVIVRNEAICVLNY